MDYYPPGPVSSRFMKSDAFVVGLMGPFGSGKTTACIAKALKISARQPKRADGKRYSRGAIIRNTYPELRTTTMKSWFDWVPQHCGHWQPEGPPTHTVEIGDCVIEVIFLALDRPEDIRKLLSLELTWAWINEGRETPKAIMDALTGRVGRYPAVRDGGCVDPQILMDTNPPDTDHWWYVLAERDETTDYGKQLVASTDEADALLREHGVLRPGQKLFEWFRQPSGVAREAENVANLPPGYYAKLMAGKSEDWIRVYARGEYGYVRDGKAVYPEYSQLVHERAFELAPRVPIRIGLDFGLTPAATISHRDMLGRWRVRSEVVTEDMGATKFAKELGRHLRERFAGHPVEAVRGDPAGNHRSEADDEDTVFKVLKAHMIDAQPAPTNDFTIRRDAVGNLLTRLVDSQPAILIHPECRVLRKGMAGAYCLRRLQVVGHERYEDKPQKNMYSHVCEALQYDVVSGGEGKSVIRADPELERLAYGGRYALPAVADLDYPTFPQ